MCQAHSSRVDGWLIEWLSPGDAALDHCARLLTVTAEAAISVCNAPGSYCTSTAFAHPHKNGILQAPSCGHACQ
jgi:hypothetical protein